MNKFASIALSLALALAALAPAAATSAAATATTTTASTSTAAPVAKTTQMRWRRVCNQYRCWWVRTYYVAGSN